MGQTVANSRRSQRYDTTLLARVVGETSLREYRGNISAGGFCYECGVEIETGTMVDIIFRLPGAGFWMMARGRVLGTIQGVSSIGVRGCFTEIQMGDADRLTQWLSNHVRQVA